MKLPYFTAFMMSTQGSYSCWVVPADAARTASWAAAGFAPSCAGSGAAVLGA